THQMIQSTWDISSTGPVFPRIVSSVGGKVQWTETTYSCNVSGTIQGGTIRSNYFFLASDGTRYSFPNRSYSGYAPCPGVNYTTVATGVSSEGAVELDTPANLVRLKNGNTPIEDTNGNFATLISGVTDTIKRSYTFSNLWNLNYSDSSGN